MTGGMPFPSATTRKRSSMRRLGSGSRAAATTTTWSTFAASGCARGLPSPVLPPTCRAGRVDAAVEVLLHHLERQREHLSQRLSGRLPPGEVLGLDVAHRAIARLGPAHEEESRAVASGRIRRIVHERGDGVRLTVLAAERRRPLVHPLVTAQRAVVQLRRNDSLTTLPSRNAMFAGRSASRRMRYGYQWLPNGT